MLYSDYFALAKSYHPVFSEATIANDDWQDTYPHETFVELLLKTEKMLSRQDGKSTNPSGFMGHTALAKHGLPGH